MTHRGHAVLSLIDEIFKGANNRERLIGSRAFLIDLTIEEMAWG